MPEDPIIIRARNGGSRRLVSVPAETGSVADENVRASTTSAGKTTGLAAFLQSAQRQGAELVAVAREQAGEIATVARETGYREGYDEGKAQAEREVSDLLAFAENAVREVVQVRSQLIADSDAALVGLAIDVAQRILRIELDVHPEHVVEVLRGALRKAFVRDRLQIVCNPEDLKLIEDAQGDLAESVGTLNHLELLGDRRIARGGVIVRTEAGDVDATLESQLERLREAMLGGGNG